MTKYLITINRDSIKKNPRAGRSDYPVLGRSTTKKIVIQKIELVEEYIKTANGWELILSNETIVDKKEEIVKSQDIHIVYALSPEPAYLYSYDDVYVECDSCHRSFSHNELQEEYYDNLDINSYNICPFCKTSDCCEIEFEKFTEEMLAGKSHNE